MNYSNKSLFRFFRFKQFFIIGFIIFIALQNCAQVGRHQMQACVMGGVGTTELPYKKRAQEKKTYVGKVNERVITGRILTGIQFHPYGMFEVDYLHFGKMDFDGTWTYMGVPTEDKGEIKTKGFSAAVVGRWPFRKKFSLLGRLGLFRWSVDEDEVFGGIPESHSASGTSPLFGAAFQTEVIKRLGIRFEWQHFQSVGKQEETGEGNIDVFGVNMFYTFPL